MVLTCCSFWRSAYFQPGILDESRWLRARESECQWRRCRRCGFVPWVGKMPWSRKWQPTPVFLPGKLHGERTLAGHSPWGHQESDATEHARIHSVWTHLDNTNSSLQWVDLREGERRASLSRSLLWDILNQWGSLLPKVEFPNTS